MCFNATFNNISVILCRFPYGKTGLVIYDAIPILSINFIIF